MSAPGKAEGGVNRLIDIVVEEVSLVDRAANKHRFLIVKRSNDMDETTTETTTSPADETAAETNHEAGSEADAHEGDAAGGSNEATTAAPLSVAVAALEGLTETVELLGSLGEEEAKPRLAALATELRGVSERLAQAAGGAAVGGDDGAASSDAADGTDAGDPAKDGEAFASAIEAVRATLGRVQGLIAADDATNAGEAGAEAGQGDGAGDGLGAQLSELLGEIRSLTGTVKEQQQRLARLEKRFGLPNSAPSGERPPKAEDQDVGWPMDLNRPFDRESVDKATSFHDV